jgi:hypothetical protein
MNSFFSTLASRLGQYVYRPARKYLSTPVGKITVFNTIMFVIKH